MSKANAQLQVFETDDSDDDCFKYFDAAVSTSSNSQLESKSRSNLKTKPPLDEVDSWSFDAFLLADATEQRPLPVLGETLFSRYRLIETFRIPPLTLKAFLNRLEDGYGNNEYHNSIHATGVAQTMHYFLSTSGLKSCLSNLEIFAGLFAAIIHDYDHNGMTNKFLVMTGAHSALLYNDRSVQENHHLSASFFVLKEPECNILENLSHEQYRHFRSMVIDMVLCTDMAFHFQMVKDMKARVNDPSPVTEINKVMSFVLHTCDIAYCGQGWNLHIKWLRRLLKEFFRQGDLEKELGLPVSPMCDRETTLVPESQIHWMDFIVEPTITTCANLIERMLRDGSSDGSALGSVMNSIDRPWIECMRENKRIWKTKIAQGKGAVAASGKLRTVSK